MWTDIQLLKQMVIAAVNCKTFFLLEEKLLAMQNNEEGKAYTEMLKC